MTLSERQQRELAHDRKILENSEAVWGRAGRAGNLRVERRARMTIGFSKIGPGKRVLEIGCGTGMLTEKLAATGATVVATDLFGEFLDRTRQKIRSGNVTFEVADAETLASFADGSFDAVVGLSILHHLDIDKTLANIHRVLKPGGALAFSEPNMANPQIALQKNIPALKKWAGDSPDETAFFKREMKELLRRYDFDEITVKPFDFLHPALPDALATAMEKIGNALEKTPLVKEIAGSLFIGARKKI